MPVAITRTLAINGRFVEQPMTGVQRFAFEVLRELDLHDDVSSGRVKIVLFVPSRALSRVPAYQHIETRSLPLWGHVWDQTSLAWGARRSGLLSMCNAGPAFHRRQTVVIHDAHVYDLPQHFPWFYRSLHQRLGRLLARRAQVVTVSEFSASRLETVWRDRLRLPVRVVPNGVDHQRRIQNTRKAALLLDVSEPYFLLVGRITENKNQIAVVQAFLENTDLNHTRLVLVGATEDELRQHGMDGNKRVIALGRVGDSELHALYRRAVALVFPSKYEGFGIPPLEALSAGTNVVAADIPAVREVCGAFPIYCDPLSRESIGKALGMAVTSPRPNRMDVLELLAGFSWKRSADSLLRIALEQVL